MKSLIISKPSQLHPVFVLFIPSQPRGCSSMKRTNPGHICDPSVNNFWGMEPKRPIICGSEVSYVLIDKKQKAFPEDLFRDVAELVVVAGLGGRTGTEFIGTACREAKLKGVANITAVVTAPFYFEGKRRIKRALECVSHLAHTPDVRLMIFNNEIIIEKYKEMNFKNAFASGDQEMMRLIEQALDATDYPGIPE